MYSSRNGKILHGNLLAWISLQKLKIMMKQNISNLQSGFVFLLLQITADNPGMNERTIDNVKSLHPNL